MKNRLFLAGSTLLLILLSSSPILAYQGRMMGMGDPFGLVEDESDFLVHPAAIAAGKGTIYYGTYQFMYDRIDDMNFHTTFTEQGEEPAPYLYNSDGHDLKNECRAGMVFPAARGRMGIFFEYTRDRGDFEGDQSSDPDIGFTYDMASTINDYALRLLYGMPLSSCLAGAELQIASRVEKNENTLYYDGLATWNLPVGGPVANILHLMIPYDSRFWEAQAKLSATGKTGSLPYAFTLHGGVPFSAKNKYDFGQTGAGSVALDGDVKGWNAGADAWLRMPLSGNLSLPFVLSVSYKDTKRDGDALGIVDYSHEAKDLALETGGGLDYTTASGARTAAGFYYDYLHLDQNFTFTMIGTPTSVDDYDDYPKHVEHRFTCKTAAEKDYSPSLAIRAGLNLFYGWVDRDYAYVMSRTNGFLYPVDISGDGYTWGANVSAGATVKLNQVSIEPFAKCGYQKLKLDGDGSSTVRGSFSDTSIDYYTGTGYYEKTNWFVGAGFSLRL
ncbi:MAG: autotransporter outer membrane beta-barrel domain-containing protein [Syntrophaceae bacterium]